MSSFLPTIQDWETADFDGKVAIFAYLWSSLSEIEKDRFYSLVMTQASIDNKDLFLRFLNICWENF